MTTVGELLRDAGHMRRVETARLRAARPARFSLGFEWIAIGVVLVIGFIATRAVLESGAPFTFGWMGVFAMWLVVINIGMGEGCLKFNDFERLHAPLGGLVLFRWWFQVVGFWAATGLALAAFVGAVLLTHTEDRAFGSLHWSDWVRIVAAFGVPFWLNWAFACTNDWIALGCRLLVSIPFVVSLPGVVDGGWAIVLLFVCVAGVVVSLVATWRGLVTLDQRRAEPIDETEGAAIRTTLQEPSATGDWDRGEQRRSLLGSATFLFAAGQRGWSRALRHAPIATLFSAAFFTAFYGLPMLFAALAVIASTDSVSLMWPVLACLVAPCLLTIDEREPVYLWGVDLQQIERHDVFVRALTVSLPACVVAAATAWWSGAGAFGWYAVLLVAACQVGRLGIAGAHPYPVANWTFLIVSVGTVTACVVGTVSITVAWIAAASLIVLGAVGILARVLRPERVLRERECF